MLLKQYDSIFLDENTPAKQYDSIFLNENMPAKQYDSIFLNENMPVKQYDSIFRSKNTPETPAGGLPRGSGEEILGRGKSFRGKKRAAY